MKKSISTILALSMVSSIYAITLKDTIKQTIVTNEEITANNLKVKAKKSRIEQAKSGYYPTVNLDAYLEKSKTTQDHNINGTNSSSISGSNIALRAEQLLYDGSKTSSLVSQREKSYSSELSRASWKNEDILLNIIKAYVGLLKNIEQKQYSNFLTQAHRETLVVAKDKEEISGEALPTQQTLVMLANQIDKEDKEIIKYKKSVSEFIKLTSIEPVDLCKPTIDKELFNVPLDDVLRIALENNYKIQEQKSILKEQEYSYKSQTSTYKPKITLNANAAYDNDLELNELGSQKDMSAQLRLSWNLYNGGADKLKMQEEEILIHKETKQLEVVKKEIIKKVTDAYNRYHTTLHRIENLKESVAANENVLKLTKEQLADGTKTFIEEIQAKDKLIESKINLSNQEIELYNRYFDLLNNLSILSKTILLSEDGECNPIIVDNPILDDLDNIQLADDNNVSDNDVNDNNISNGSTLKDEITKLVEDTYMNYDEDNLDILLHITKKSFTVKKVNPHDGFRFKLDSIAEKLLKTVLSHLDEISEVRLESYTSSEYTQYIEQSLAVQAEANTALSIRRGNKVKDYFIKKAKAFGLPDDLVINKFNVYGMGPTDLVYNADETENRVASRRIEIKIVKK